MSRHTTVPRTQAKLEFCLTDKELDELPCTKKRNPHGKNAAPMRLYERADLEAAAAAKWGGQAGWEAERAKRETKREARAATRLAAAGPVAAPGGGSGSGAAEDPFPELQLPWWLGERARLVGPANTSAASGDRCSQRPPAQALFRPSAGPASTSSASAHQQQQQYILYWMQTAMRAEENPALDFAKALAAAAGGLPVVVAAVLLLSDPHANARRYAFCLEGLRDVDAALRAAGGQLLVYCEGLTQHACGSGGTEAAGASSGSSSAVAAAPADAPAGAPGGEGVAPEAAAGLLAALLSPAYEARLAASPGWRALSQLAEGAAAVVVEDMPVPPQACWAQLLQRQLEPAGIPVWAVDTACLVPMRLCARGYERAGPFRAVHERQRKARLAACYGRAGASTAAAAAAAPADAAMPAQLCSSGADEPGGSPTAGAAAGAGPPVVVGHVPPGLGWRPLDLAVAFAGSDGSAAALVGAWPGLDQGVAPVPHLRGGSAAGYVRWDAWRRGGGLTLYASRRNDALRRAGTSRLSPWLRWGMVSPLRVAREAAAAGSGPGPTKFLDELLTWRELAYAYCFHRYPVLDTPAALPAWARDTLAAHAADPRPALKTWAQLEGGRTGDALWDAAQQQMVATGELHNNVRMTWGKALLAWAPSPAAALAAALHLNHRYCLDSCDPASYGGVLWCFGLFDGPKAGAGTAVSGSLGQRSTASHARRLTPDTYRQLPV